MTIYDLARRAKLAASTVSRALDPTQHHRVNAATRARIAKLAARLGYRPSRTARALSRGGTDTIAMVLPAHTSYIDYEYYSRVIMAGVQFLTLAHLDLKVHALADQEGRSAVMDLVSRLGVDGIIAVGLPKADHFVLPPGPRTAPIVLLNSYYDPQAASVDADNVMGGRLAAEYFIARGHTKLGMLAGPQDSQNALDRAQGYRAAIRAAKLPVRPQWFVHCRYDVEAGYEAADGLLARRDRPTALFCANDAIATGALRAAQARGLHCPRDLSLIGYDDFMPARLAVPPLTTIAQPVNAMVQAAVQQIIAIIRTGARPSRIIVPVHVVERASVAAPRRD